jgi:hypothetical protein
MIKPVVRDIDRLLVQYDMTHVHLMDIGSLYALESGGLHVRFLDGRHATFTNGNDLEWLDVALAKTLRRVTAAAGPVSDKNFFEAGLLLGLLDRHELLQ